MILKADKIAELLRQGDTADNKDPLAVIPRPDLKRLAESGSAAIDLRLGTWFTSLRQARTTAFAQSGAVLPA